MPIYDYVCMSCESHFEELVGMSDPDPACPDCGNLKVAKQFSTSFAAHGVSGQPSFGGGGCCGGGCGRGGWPLPSPPPRPRPRVGAPRAPPGAPPGGASR